MHSSLLLRLPALHINPNSETLDFHGGLPIHPWRSRIPVKGGRVVTMRDRSKNRKQLQRGRNLSIEAIQAVQALKRSMLNGCGASVDRVLETKVRRLIKLDMMAVLRELQRQNEGLLAFQGLVLSVFLALDLKLIQQVFEEVRKEYWYKPQLSVYVDMITVLASNGLLEKVEQLCSYLKKECLEADTEGFNALLRTMLEFGFTQTALDCFRLMKLWESEPNESTFRILINGLESKGEMDTSAIVRQEAEKYFGTTLDFLEQDEETVLTYS